MGEVFFNRRAGRELWALILAAARPGAELLAPRCLAGSSLLCSRPPTLPRPAAACSGADQTSPSPQPQANLRHEPRYYYRYCTIDTGASVAGGPQHAGGVGGTPQAGRAAECVRPADQLTFERSRVDPRRKRRRKQFLRRRRLANSGTVKTLTNRGGGRTALQSQIPARLRP